MTVNEGKDHSNQNGVKPYMNSTQEQNEVKHYIKSQS